MSKELVISSNRHETRVAIVEEDQLVEIYFQRANEYSLAGSVHKGRVTRVLPGMQSAFVDLGLERDTFLYVSDFFEDHGEDYDKVTGGAEERPAVVARTERPEREERSDRGDRGGRDRGGRDRGGRNRHERPDRAGRRCRRSASRRPSSPWSGPRRSRPPGWTPRTAPPGPRTRIP
jgi:ribonuclease E